MRWLSLSVFGLALATLSACPVCDDSQDPPLPDAQSIVNQDQSPETIDLIQRCRAAETDACISLCAQVNRDLDVPQPGEYKYGYLALCEVEADGDDWIIHISYWSTVQC